MILLGFLFGVLGGCGIGGGSLLVPSLVLIFNLPQKTAQGVCIIAFLPAALCGILVHIKNKNINYKLATKYIFTGIIFAIFGAILTRYFGDAFLRKMFGWFLIGFSLFQFVSVRKSIK